MPVIFVPSNAFPVGLSSVQVQESNADLNGPPIAISRCKHAAAILGSGDIPKTDIPPAVAVAFGKDGEGIESVATNSSKQDVHGEGEYECCVKDGRRGRRARATAFDATRRPSVVRGVPSGQSVYSWQLGSRRGRK